MVALGRVGAKMDVDSVVRVRSPVPRTAPFGEVGVTGALPGELGRGGRPDVARAVSDAWGAHVAVLDATGRILEVNEAWKRFGSVNGNATVAEGADYFAVCEASAAAEPTAAVVVDGLRALAVGTTDRFAVEYPCHSPGRQRWFQLTARRLSEGGATELLVIHEDVSDRRPTLGASRVASTLLDEVAAAVVATDAAGIITLWNPGAERLYGWSSAEAVGASMRDLIAPEGQGGDAHGSFDQALDGDGASRELTLSRKDGTTFAAEIRTSPIADAAGLVTGMVGVAVDLTGRLSARRETAEQLRAITDTIGDGVCTLDSRGLVTYANPPARRMLRSSLAEVTGGSFFLWLHAHGRAPRRDAASTASNGAPPHHAVPTVNAAQPVPCQLARPDGTELPIEYVATRLPAAEGVIEAAWVVVFRDLSDRRARQDQLAAQIEQVGWLTRIRDALDNDGFVLHAQPIVDIKTGRTVQHELLIRMRDPDQPDTLIPPDRFLPTAETLGVAAAIDRWVLARGFEFAALGYPVEINLSATSLEDVTLPHLIEQLLHDSGAHPGNIVLEITETALLDNDVTAQYFADRIRQLGCELALDDFGTGYGGFTYLKRYPLDYLKIDIEFVRDAMTSAASRHVIESVVSLARAFGLRTIAEGVEDVATLRLLGTLDVDLAQGFLLGRPALSSTVFTPTPPERRHL
jgi:PAS domain S-box-containing protein